jgi:hypothetical protein
LGPPHYDHDMTLALTMYCSAFKAVLKECETDAQYQAICRAAELMVRDSQVARNRFAKEQEAKNTRKRCKKPAKTSTVTQQAATSTVTSPQPCKKAKATSTVTINSQPSASNAAHHQFSAAYPLSTTSNVYPMPTVTYPQPSTSTAYPTPTVTHPQPSTSTAYPTPTVTYPQPSTSTAYPQPPTPTGVYPPLQDPNTTQPAFTELPFDNDAEDVDAIDELLRGMDY